MPDFTTRTESLDNVPPTFKVVVQEMVTTGEEDREGLEVLAAFAESVQDGGDVTNRMLEKVWGQLMGIVGIDT